MREKKDYAALLQQRRAEKAQVGLEPHMVETREAPEFTFDQWPPEGTPEVRPFDEYIKTREGRCEHGYHLAAQGCPRCGVASAEEVVEHFLNARR